MKLTILIACFNEKATILKAIEEAKELNIDKEIIVIDNNSTDGTRQLLEGLKDDKSLKIILHSQNMGGGYSTLEAISLAQGDYFYSPGADLEYKMEDVYKMIDKLEKEDLDAVFGSRLLGRNDISIYGLIKERPYWLGTIITTFLINILFRKNLTDIIGTSLIKVSTLRALNCKTGADSYVFELTSRLCKNGCRIGEAPVWYQPRTHEEGKTTTAILMIPAIMLILKVKFFG